MIFDSFCLQSLRLPGETTWNNKIKLTYVLLYMFHVVCSQVLYSLILDFVICDLEKL